MRYGICMDLADGYKHHLLAEKLGAIHNAGYDYIETSVSGLSHLSEVETLQIRGVLERNGLTCLRANGFFPPQIRLTGPGASAEEIEEYLKTVLPRAAGLGVKTIVLGSGASRQIPDDMPYQHAFEQFCEYGKMICKQAEAYGIRIAIEHLNPRETNFITTIEEAGAVIDSIGMENCGLLFDYYHIDADTNDLRNVAVLKEKLFHVHAAVPETRKYPRMADEPVMRPFFETVAKAAYDGTVSVEASMNEGMTYEENLNQSLQLFRQHRPVR